MYKKRWKSILYSPFKELEFQNSRTGFWFKGIITVIYIGNQYRLSKNKKHFLWDSDDILGGLKRLRSILKNNVQSYLISGV